MIIEIKILCDCGTKYKFDVEPLEGRLPSPVHCPGCGSEGTETANAQLRQKLAPPMASLAKTAPLPSFKTAAPASIVAAPLIVEPGPAPHIPPARSVRTDPTPLVRARFAWGVVGAVVAGLFGTLAWYGLVTVTGYQIGFAAWGVGLLVGGSARRLGGVGSSRLGWVAAFCALAAIAIGQWVTAPSHGNSPSTLFENGSGPKAITVLWLLLAAASAWKLGSGGALLTKGQVNKLRGRIP